MNSAYASYKLLFAAGTVAALALSAAPSSAGSPSASSGLGTWEGAGVTYDGRGAELGPFAVTLTRTALADGKVRAEGQVTLANGTRIPFRQEVMYRGAGGFTLTSSLGQGGGRCFADGMCQTYESGTGHDFATTMVFDGPTRLRMLVTELDGGQPVRFFQQTLSKRP